MINRQRSSPDFVWPVVLKYIETPRSVVDIGCGTGHWIAAIKELHPEVSVFGVNSPERADAGLYLEKDEYQHADLTKPLALGKKFDVAVCVELAEHLPPSAADTLVDSIVAHSDVVIFGAAIPGQDGPESPVHFNEQWPDYWIKKFKQRGYECYDYLRPVLWNHHGVSVWYRQNFLLFMKPPRKPLIETTDWKGEAIVHPQYFVWVGNKRRRTFGNLIRFIRGKPMLY